jgi:hypothetical protein
MVMFNHNTTPPRQQPTHGSFLSTLLNDVRAKSATLLRFLYDKDDDALQVDDDDDDDDHQKNNKNVLFDALIEMEEAASVEIPHVEPMTFHAPPVAAKPKKKRTKCRRMDQRSSIWWTRFLTPTHRAELLNSPNGRLANQFRKLFHVPYVVFLDLMQVATNNWWQEWHEDNKCRAGKLVSSLDLKIMGSLFVLAQGVSHLCASICSNISEEVHRSFFNKWIRDMLSIKDEYIFMPQDDFTFRKVSQVYASRGLPGCVGSVDCVHIGWDRCPVQYKNMYTGKEGFPSVAYEVICTARKFIQSVSCGHPGTRNDKHIAKTDPSVMQLLENNSWLNSRAWHCSGHEGKKTFFGVYLICDGGYHTWPCLVSPSKNGMPGTPEMRWSKNLESVRKDIEGVFGILKVRFRFLKNFNNLRHQSSIDDAFTTCCILHNMMLRRDGYLDDNLAPFPGGLEERLAKRFGTNRWNGLEGLWIRDEDDDEDNSLEQANTTAALPPLVALPTPTFFSEREKKILTERHKRVKNALVDHFEYGCRNN